MVHNAIEAKGGMMFGRTLVIVNPAARSGKAAEVAAHAALIFDRIQKRQSQPMRLTIPLHRGTQRRNANRINTKAQITTP